jgi:hypothetical protein
VGAIFGETFREFKEGKESKKLKRMMAEVNVGNPNSFRTMIGASQK